MNTIYCYFDGSCSVNPGGVMGMGYVIDNCGYSDKVGSQPSNSNNIAEYTALYMLLEKLIENNLQYENIIVRGDSLLIINQINGKWRAKKPHLQSLLNQCKDLLVVFNSIQFEWIPREQNQVADRLSTL